MFPQDRQFAEAKISITVQDVRIQEQLDNADL